MCCGSYKEHTRIACFMGLEAYLSALIVSWRLGSCLSTLLVSQGIGTCLIALIYDGVLGSFKRIAHFMVSWVLFESISCFMGSLGLV